MKIVLFIVWSNVSVLFGYWLCKRRHNDGDFGE